jgi:hypothetical protein
MIKTENIDITLPDKCPRCGWKIFTVSNLSNESLHANCKNNDCLYQVYPPLPEVQIPNRRYAIESCKSCKHWQGLNTYNHLAQCLNENVTSDMMKTHMLEVCDNYKYAGEE